MGLKIKEFREERFMTQKQLADEIGSSQRNVSHWENGTNEPDVSTLIKLADLFGVSLDELCGRTFDSSPVSDTENELYKKLSTLNKEQKTALKVFFDIFL